MQDLTEYKYDKMITKTLAVLNKFFSLKTYLFTRAVEAQVRKTTHTNPLQYLHDSPEIISIIYFHIQLWLQVLITPDSVRVHREVLKCIPVLRRLTNAKLNSEQVKTMSEILDSFTR